MTHYYRNAMYKNILAFCSGEKLEKGYYQAGSPATSVIENVDCPECLVKLMPEIVRKRERLNRCYERAMKAVDEVTSGPDPRANASVLPVGAPAGGTSGDQSAVRGASPGRGECSAEEPGTDSLPPQAP